MRLVIIMSVSRTMQCMSVLDTSMNEIQGSARTAITKASEYMTGLYDNSEEFCNYALALSTFSMLREPSGRTPRIVSRMVADLKTRIITSKDCESLLMCCYHCSH